MLCMATAPFQMDLSREFQRPASAVLLLLVFIIARRKRLQANPDFPADEYSVIQAVAWAGIYACLNLHLSSLWPSIRSIRDTVMTGDFQLFTFAAIWLLPGIGLFLAIRDRDRMLLDVSIILSLVTLATNKPYLGMVRQTWDPILLGVFLIGTAVALRRWLSARDRTGFTAERILIADKRGLAALGTASAALQTFPQPPPTAAPAAKFEPGGGRSGGGGASGAF